MHLGTIERKFAEIIWENEPIPSGELVKICEVALNWNKSTTYTVLRRLCQRGIFKNEKYVVTSVLSKKEFGAAEGRLVIDHNFDGSIVSFLAAYSEYNKLSDEDIAGIRKLLNACKKK